MDIKAEIEKIVKLLLGDNAKLNSFKKDPIAFVKSLLGDKVTEEILKKVVEGVTKELAAQKSSGILDKVKGLFGK